jgi:hypothetical protein
LFTIDISVSKQILELRKLSKNYKWKEGRKAGRKEGRKEGKKKEKKDGRKKGRMELNIIYTLKRNQN